MSRLPSSVSTMLRTSESKPEPWAKIITGLAPGFIIVEGAAELSEPEQPNNKTITATDTNPPDVIIRPSSGRFCFLEESLLSRSDSCRYQENHYNTLNFIRVRDQRFLYRTTLKCKYLISLPQSHIVAIGYSVIPMTG